MRTYNGHVSKKACCCDTPLCEQIGYSHEGMFRIPTDPSRRGKVLSALGIKSADLRNKIHSNPRSYMIAPWHYHPEHRVLSDNGAWIFRDLEVYTDNDGKKFDFPPPNAKLRDYIESIKTHEFSRGGWEDGLPSWARKLINSVSKQQNAPSAQSTSNVPPTKPTTTPLSRPVSNPPPSLPISGLKAKRLDYATTSAPRGRTKRSSPEAQHIEELEETARMIQDRLNEKVKELNESLSREQQLRITVEQIGQENLQIRVENDKLRSEIQSLNEKLRDIETSNLVLTYDDLREGGVLGEYVKDFTFFPTVEANDAFLWWMNFAEGCPDDDGLCENMTRYHMVSVEEKKQYNATRLSDNGDVEMVDTEEDTTKQKRGRKRSLHWKTEWLVYCFYAMCTAIYPRTGPLHFLEFQIHWYTTLFMLGRMYCVLRLESSFPSPPQSDATCIPKKHHKKVLPREDLYVA
jgi:hypothetical protein